VRERAFNAQPWEVRAFLAGQKTQIRRPVQAPQSDNGRPVREIVSSRFLGRGLWDVRYDLDNPHSIPCPYGVPGERLWARWPYWHYTPPSTNPINEQAWDEMTRVVRWRTGESVDDVTPDTSASALWRHRSASSMPRWASRLTLEVVDVRVQRLAEISKADAIAEGATRREWAKAPAGWSACGWSVDWSRVGTLSRYAGGIHKRGHEQPLTERDICLGSPQMAFASEWERANGKRAPWDSNPFVWAVTFRAVARG
jgi:hypothetical protein